MTTPQTIRKDVRALLQERRTLRTSDLESYRRFTFSLPKGVTHLEVTLTYESEGGGRIYPILLGPEGFRGFSMSRLGRGKREVQLWLANDGASPGSLPGPLEAGSWTLVLDPMGLTAETTLEVTVVASFEPRDSLRLPGYPADVVTNPAAGWYRGELHAHTLHSDGADTTTDLVASARQHGLDFLALTDHFTTSGWSELVQEVGGTVALIRGMELTSHKGHANLLGIDRWVDVLVDDPARSINDAVHDAHTAGGLFSVNHAYSNVLGWQRHDIDWAAVDLLEIYHHLENQHNILQLALWDSLLNQGYRIVGIGATDSHNAFSGRHRLGQAFTCVYCDELSERGVIAGLKRGRVYATLGPEIGFCAEQGGTRLEMWDSAVLGQAVMFHAETNTLNCPATLFVIKNGLYFDHIDVEPGETTWAFSDTPETASYYRLEWHTLPHFLENPQHRYRAWDTFLAASNPIFAGASFHGGRWK